MDNYCKTITSFTTRLITELLLRQNFDFAPSNFIAADLSSVRRILILDFHELLSNKYCAPKKSIVWYQCINHQLIKIFLEFLLLRITDASWGRLIWTEYLNNWNNESHTGILDDFIVTLIIQVVSLSHVSAIIPHWNWIHE